MLTVEKFNYHTHLVELTRTRTLAAADNALTVVPMHITDHTAAQSDGYAHDYYSNGDYWWPDPDTPDGLPYIRRDGLSNADNFKAHRYCVMELKKTVTALAVAHRLLGQAAYAEKAVTLLTEFFLDPGTKMNPHMRYAQAIPGRCSGRGIGIIDALHLVEVAIAIRALRDSAAMSNGTYQALQEWFAEFTTWIMTHPYGRNELNHLNNHAVAFILQLAGFARLTENEDMLQFCRERFCTVLLPNQMDADGSFPAELARTKPYVYSLFQADNLAVLAHIASTEEDNLWEFALGDGRCMARALEFIVPYIAEKSDWPYPPDVEDFDSWPVNHICLLFGGIALDQADYIALWERLDPTLKTFEVWRNVAVTQPLLWM